MKAIFQRLVVVPTDPISAYEKAGYDWLDRYYNPKGIFKEVFALSPLEKGRRDAYGMTILGVSESDFRKAIFQLRPDAVRAYGGYWPSDLVLASRVSGIPVIVSVHDMPPVALHRSARYADMVICMSRAVREYAISRGVNSERARVLPNRVDRRIFFPTVEKQELAKIGERFPHGKHILHVGRKCGQKNLDTLIRAMVSLPKDYSVIFVGQGDESPYRALAQECNVADRCFWIDRIQNSDLRLWYSWCDCFCVPSRHEGFGIVFIEAAACGAAIVTSDLAPMNEYLVDQKSASLVKDYENPKSVAERIQRVCEDREFRKLLSTGAVQAAIPFDCEAVDEAEAAIYREVIEKGSLPLPNHMEFRLWRWKRKLSLRLSK